MQLHIYLTEEEIKKLQNGDTLAMTRGNTLYMPSISDNAKIFLHKEIEEED